MVLYLVAFPLFVHFVIFVA